MKYTKLSLYEFWLDDEELIDSKHFDTDKQAIGHGAHLFENREDRKATPLVVIQRIAEITEQENHGD